MILFLCGLPGVGKSTVGSALASRGALHIEFDTLRFRLGARNTTDPGVEDAINWRAMKLAMDAQRENIDRLIIMDSTGVSTRIPYLRTALGGVQSLVLLASQFPMAMASKKWGKAYSSAQLDHLQGMIQCLPVNQTIIVDNKTPEEIIREIIL